MKGVRGPRKLGKEDERAWLDLDAVAWLSASSIRAVVTGQNAHHIQPVVLNKLPLSLPTLSVFLCLQERRSEE